MYKKYLQSADIVIVGAGISGAVLAERYASMGKQVVVLESRNHIGGNCYDKLNEVGIRVSQYGAHLFHTNDEAVWNYVNQFSDWYSYEHRVLAKVDNKLVPIPVNITTVNKLFNLNIRDEREMKMWLSEEQIKKSSPNNGKEAALARVGPVLYEKMFKNYTKKQWDKFPEELDASVLNRIPVRTNFDDRYFSDTYQALPQKGYTYVFQQMLDNKNIVVLLDTDYFEVRKELGPYEKLFYTGPIDRFFGAEGKNEQLEYRSITFVSETIDKEFYQSNSVINYPNDEDYTRIVEYKHITKQVHRKTTIVKEYTRDRGDPYYPVPNPRNQKLYEKYQKKTEHFSDIFFVGRLANYKYFNMDQAFKNALDLFHKLEPDYIVHKPVYHFFYNIERPVLQVTT